MASIFMYMDGYHWGLLPHQFELNVVGALDRVGQLAEQRLDARPRELGVDAQRAVGQSEQLLPGIAEGCEGGLHLAWGAEG